MHGLAAADGLLRKNPGDIDGVECAQAAAIFAGYFHSTLLLAGSAGLFLAEQPQHFLDLLLAAAAAESSVAGLECADVVLGEYFVQELMAGPIDQVLRTQSLHEEAKPPPVIFERR